MANEQDIKDSEERLTRVERILERMALQNEEDRRVHAEERRVHAEEHRVHAEEHRLLQEESRRRDEWRRQDEEAHKRFLIEIDAIAAENRATAALQREANEKINMLIEAEMRLDARVDKLAADSEALKLRVDETTANVDKLTNVVGNMLRGQV